MASYTELRQDPQHKPVWAWIDGVPVDERSEQQLHNIASLPFVHHHIAAMPDVHVGMGATIGSVIPTAGAIIPAAVGVDIGCGMLAAQTSLVASQLPDNLASLRSKIEAAVPHGYSSGRDKGSWHDLGCGQQQAWDQLALRFDQIVQRKAELLRRKSRKVQPIQQLGTLGGGNHFIELCLEQTPHPLQGSQSGPDAAVWIMLHSGSRGIGNAIGSLFIELAKQDLGQQLGSLPDGNLAYLREGSQHFDDYVLALNWAQDYARSNRELMFAAILEALRAEDLKLPPFTLRQAVVNCHHNYTTREQHYGAEVWLTRKGAVRAGAGELGIIPGSMGAKSFIVRGKGSAESFCSCSHGAGRALSRKAAKERFSIEDHQRDTAGVECRKDLGVIDETPRAYKSIDKVMAAQSDLVEIVHTIKQVLCVKG